MEFRFPEKKRFDRIESDFSVEGSSYSNMHGASFENQPFRENGSFVRQSLSNFKLQCQDLFENFKKVEMKHPSKRESFSLFNDRESQKTNESDPKRANQSNKTSQSKRTNSRETGINIVMRSSPNETQLEISRELQESASMNRNKENIFKKEHLSQTGLEISESVCFSPRSSHSQPKQIQAKNSVGNRANGDHFSAEFQGKVSNRSIKPQDHLGRDYETKFPLKTTNEEPQNVQERPSSEAIANSGLLGRRIDPMLLEKEAIAIESKEKDTLNESMKSSEIKNLIECDLETFAQFFAKKAAKSSLLESLEPRERANPTKPSAMPESNHLASHGRSPREADRLEANPVQTSPFRSKAIHDNQTESMGQSEIFAVNAVSHDLIQLTSPSSLSVDQSCFFGELSTHARFFKKNRPEIPRVPIPPALPFENPILEVSEDLSTLRCPEKEAFPIKKNFQVQLMNPLKSEKEFSQAYESTKTVGFESRKDEFLSKKENQRPNGENILEKSTRSKKSGVFERSSRFEEVQNEKYSSNTSHELLTVTDLTQWKAKSGNQSTKGDSVSGEKEPKSHPQDSNDLVQMIRAVVKECLQGFIADYEKDKREYMIPSKIICESINQKVTDILQRQNMLENSIDTSFSQNSSSFFPSGNQPASDSFSGCFFPEIQKNSRGNPGSIRRSRSNAKMNRTGQEMCKQNGAQDSSWSDSSSGNSSYYNAIEKMNGKLELTDRENISRGPKNPKEPKNKVPPLPLGKKTGFICHLKGNLSSNRSNSSSFERKSSKVEKEAEEEKFKRNLQRNHERLY